MQVELSSQLVGPSDVIWRDWCGLVCVIKPLTFTQWDTGWLMHYEVRKEYLQITFYCGNTHMGVQIDGVRHRAPYLFDAAVNSLWLYWCESQRFSLFQTFSHIFLQGHLHFQLINTPSLPVRSADVRVVNIRSCDMLIAEIVSVKVIYVYFLPYVVKLWAFLSVIAFLNWSKWN